MSGVKEDIFSICHATLRRLNSRPWHPRIFNFVDLDLQAFNENGKAGLHCHTVTSTERTELERSFNLDAMSQGTYLQPLRLSSMLEAQFPGKQSFRRKELVA